MVIGTFFSQTGISLLKLFSSWDILLKTEGSALVIKKTESDMEFKAVAARFASYKSGIEYSKINFEGLKRKMIMDRAFLLGLLENQNLLEHEQFTDLLWATFHLLEELSLRDDFTKLPVSDLNHLAGDVNRVYTMLICQWVMYMQHLKKNYPYLFSLAMRTNPFDSDARVEV
jgi:hypothetical protein